MLRLVPGLSDAEIFLLTWTVRMYLITLCGYSVHEVVVRAFYARKEALFPLKTVAIRLAIYLAVGISVIAFFPALGAPGIAIAEIALTVEAIILFIWLGRRLQSPLRFSGVLLKGLISAIVGGLLAYALARYVPGSAVLTALLGMVAGGLIALSIVWSEVKLLLKL